MSAVTDGLVARRERALADGDLNVARACQADLERLGHVTRTVETARASARGKRNTAQERPES